ncbi:uncharacterized protein LOC118418121 [Branchiostoma floridae]|uniref:Uncharacterized protein LOC118418121 n=1 Tax=Branchiostoma floridae TaxID=7739 RepID=A0A9J7LDL2_BRAFL|nr:uncharacterized protein LOC118418121 [Branchiostoma floridae]
MEERHQRLLRQKSSKLAEGLSEIVSEVTYALFEKGDITFEQRELVEGGRENADKARRLLRVLPTGGPTAFRDLQDAVRDRNRDLSDILEEESQLVDFTMAESEHGILDDPRRLSWEKIKRDTPVSPSQLVAKHQEKIAEQVSWLEERICTLQDDTEALVQELCGLRQDCRKVEKDISMVKGEKKGMCMRLSCISTPCRRAILAIGYGRKGHGTAETNGYSGEF